MELKPSDIGIRFTRRNYENILQKTQVLTTMLANPKIAPRLAFVHCGMFTAPDQAYRESVKYAEEQEAKAQALMKEAGQQDGQTGTVSDTRTTANDTKDSQTGKSSRDRSNGGTSSDH